MRKSRTETVKSYSIVGCLHLQTQPVFYYFSRVYHPEIAVPEFSADFFGDLLSGLRQIKAKMFLCQIKLIQ